MLYLKVSCYFYGSTDNSKVTLLVRPTFAKRSSTSICSSRTSLSSFDPPGRSVSRSYTQVRGMSIDIEAAKRAAAQEAVRNHFPENPRFVGIGSGTTIVYVVQAIKELGRDVSRVGFVPTGYQSKQLIINAGLLPIEFDALPDGVQIDIAFDGADEVDEELNCIKGGGACLYQEKLVAMRSKIFICVADHRKLQSRLMTKWPTIPIEAEPKSARQVMARLRVLGSRSPSGGGPFLREGLMVKAGPVKTDQDFFIIDAPFPQPLLTSSDLEAGKEINAQKGIWEVEALARTIKDINGVLAVGIFCGPTGPEAEAAGVIGGQRPVACYFGMEDGSVEIRRAREKRHSVVATYPAIEPVISKEH